MNINSMKGKSFTVAVLETFVITNEIISGYKEHMDDHEHNLDSLMEYLADRMVPIFDKSETSHIVIAENNKEQ